MGMTKRMLEEAMERGYTLPDKKFVCGDCVSNEILRGVLESEAIQAPCPYCNRCTAAPIQVLLIEIADAAFSGFTDAANELPYESREGGYHWRDAGGMGRYFESRQLDRE